MANGTIKELDTAISSGSARAHDGSGPLLLCFEAVCVLSVAALAAIHLWRFVATPIAFTWLIPTAVIAAWMAADFVTGVVHWAADTWGEETTPFWGPRFLRPFRVHHITPRSFLECGFFDTNGDTAMLCIPGLLLAFLLPLHHPMFAAAAVFCVAFCAIGAPTNQIHQWAHQAQPPRVVAVLQKLRIILPPEEHERHHRHPHVTRYCISSGVCNPLLDAVRFFPRLEQLITRVTGVQPRHDEESHPETFNANADLPKKATPPIQYEAKTTDV